MYKSRRDQGKAATPKLTTMKIEEAMAEAKKDPRVEDVADAICWIMDRSDYYRSRGYDQTLKDVQDAVARYNNMPTEEAAHNE